jgi:hypothetical protein
LVEIVIKDLKNNNTLVSPNKHKKPTKEQALENSQKGQNLGFWVNHLKDELSI